MPQPNIPTLRELRDMPEEELVQAYDARARRSIGGPDFYLAEIRAREAARQTGEMVRLTRLMTFLTAVVTIATLVNVGLLIVT